MNALVSELIHYQYKNNDINHWIKIYLRTKNKRIKNKQFSRILVAAVKERKTIIANDVVLLDVEVYLDLKNNVMRR